MVYNKPAKRNNAYDNYANSNKNIDVSSQLDLDIYVIDNLDETLLELLVKGYENKKIAVEVKTPLAQFREE
jgi:hypothetical protein